MKILIDTRDQQPWEFPGIITVRRALIVGDYSLVGYDKTVAVERKSAADMAGSMTTSIDRLTMEFRKAKENDIKLYIVVEAGFTAVADYMRNYLKNVDPCRRLATFITRTGCTPVFADTRNLAKTIALALLVKHSENSQ